MLDLSRHFNLHKLGLSLTLFIFTSINVLPISYLNSIEINDVVVGIRISQIAERGKKYLEKMDATNLFEVMWDLKEEIESYSGQSINIDHILSDVFKEVKKKGHKISSKQEKELRKIFNRKKIRFEHKKNHRAMCFASNIDYDPILEDQMFRSKHAKDREEPEIEVIVPFKMIIGVTGALCGFFLYFIPVPGTGYLATFLMTTGVKYCCDSVIEAVQENDKKEKREKHA